ncbi:hypothetical protein D918_01311 [Trichuris suis]|nr:hypothetical protein D918_01311 [Trichuris suis]
MANIAVQRIIREFKEVSSSQELEATGIKVTVETDTYQELKGEIRGPPDSPYEGGIYEMAIQIPEMYPFHPPKLRAKCRPSTTRKFDRSRKWESLK